MHQQQAAARFRQQPGLHRQAAPVDRHAAEPRLQERMAGAQVQAVVGLVGEDGGVRLGRGQGSQVLAQVIGVEGF